MENSKPIVTIKCLVYNHEPYIRKCLEGFVMQKTNFKFEAIVHDDASTDRSAEIIKEFANKYPNIIKPIFEKENQYSKKDGSLRAIMNNYMNGKYIALCEGDDYWIDENKLQTQVDFLEQNKEFSLCFHDTYTYSLFSNSYFEKFKLPKKSRKYSAIDIYRKGWFIPTASMLYRNIIDSEYPIWASSAMSGDIIIQMLLSKYGNFWYIAKKMSVYNFGTEGSCSYNMKKDKTYTSHENYLNLLSNANKYLYSNKYTFYVFLKKVRFFIRRIINMIFN